MIIKDLTPYVYVDANFILRDVLVMNGVAA